MSRKEVDEAIFTFERPNNKGGFKTGPPRFVSTELPPEQQGESLCFDIWGQLTKDERGCAAKKVTKSKNVRYFAKWGTSGSNKGHLLNPNSLYFTEGDEKRVESRRGGMLYEFKLISETAFHNYVKFLQTKTFVFYQAAEREILND